MLKQQSGACCVYRVFIVSLSIFILFLSGTSSSQGEEDLIPQISQGDIQFYVDYAGFKSFEDDRMAYEEVYLSVLGTQLSFVEEEDAFCAVAEVNAVLRDVRGSRVKTEHWKLGCEVETLEEAQKKMFLFDVFGFAMKPGEYSLEVEVKDPNSGRKGSNTLQFEILPFKGDDLMSVGHIEYSLVKAHFRQPLAQFNHFFNPHRIWCEFDGDQHGLLDLVVTPAELVAVALQHSKLVS